MGCDIHQRTFLYSPSNGEYLDVSRCYDETECCKKPVNNLGDYIENIVGDRSYRLFGVLGNTFRDRTFEPMRCINLGVPDMFFKLRKKDVDNRDYHSFAYVELGKLKYGLKRYRSKLLHEMNDTVNIRTDKYYRKYKYNRKTHREIEDVSCMYYTLGHMIKDIEKIENLKNNTEFMMKCDLAGFKPDLRKTMFVFFYDN